MIWPLGQVLVVYLAYDFQILRIYKMAVSYGLQLSSADVTPFRSKMRLSCLGTCWERRLEGMGDAAFTTRYNVSGGARARPSERPVNCL